MFKLWFDWYITLANNLPRQYPFCELRVFFFFQEHKAETSVGLKPGSLSIQKRDTWSFKIYIYKSCRLLEKLHRSCCYQLFPGKVSKFSYIAFKPPDLSPHRLTIYKIFKATYNFHSKTQFPLKHQQYYRISFTDKIHNWNGIKIIFYLKQSEGIYP